VTDVAELAAPYTLARLRPLLPAAPARLLEVGAGSGALAGLLGRAGYQVTVVEPDGEGARACAARGLDVRAVRFEELPVGPERYHAVLFTRVLHHLPDPAGAVRRAVGHGDLVLVEDFARDEVDLLGAGFVYDGRAALAAAGLLADAEDAAAAGEVGADPLARWRDVPAELRPLHPGATLLAALAGQVRLTHLARTEMLWRTLLRSVRLPARRMRTLAETWRGIELRRIAEGTMPAVGILAAATSGPAAGGSAGSRGSAV
jgi:SAM-dependent methyltransferase